MWRDVVRAIRPGLRDVPRSRLFSLGALWAAFGACLVIRFWHVFYDSPLNHLFSDPNRHWQNGRRFFWPDLMGSADPLMYQVWIKGLQWIDHGVGNVTLAGTAVLSMALPFFWYKALRELLPAAWALAAAVTIGFMPSLFTIYSYFMNETLLLSLVACGFWLTLRAMRTRTLSSLAAAAAIWALAGYTRIVALPLAALCYAALATTLSWRKRLAFASAIGVCFGALAIPACWHSTKNLNFCAPFGSGYFNQIYKASSAKTLRMNVLTKGGWVFSSPSMYTFPLAPISEWHSTRSGTNLITIDPARGREDWQSTLRLYRDNALGLPWADDMIENAIILFFDPSWPDGDRNHGWGWLTYWNRWLWLPLTLVVGLWMARVRPNLRDGLIPGCALALILLLLVQQASVMEGRYRKPAEPLLIAGAFILLHRLRARQKPVKIGLDLRAAPDPGC